MTQEEKDQVGKITNLLVDGPFTVFSGYGDPYPLVYIGYNGTIECSVCGGDGVIEGDPDIMCTNCSGKGMLDTSDELVLDKADTTILRLLFSNDKPLLTTTGNKKLIGISYQVDARAIRKWELDNGFVRADIAFSNDFITKNSDIVHLSTKINDTKDGIPYTLNCSEGDVPLLNEEEFGYGGLTNIVYIVTDHCVYELDTEIDALTIKYDLTADIDEALYYLNRNDREAFVYVKDGDVVLKTDGSEYITTFSSIKGVKVTHNGFVVLAGNTTNGTELLFVDPASELEEYMVVDTNDIPIFLNTFSFSDDIIYVTQDDYDTPTVTHRKRVSLVYKNTKGESAGGIFEQVPLPDEDLYDDRFAPFNKNEWSEFDVSGSRSGLLLFQRDNVNKSRFADGISESNISVDVCAMDNDSLIYGTYNSHNPYIPMTTDQDTLLPSPHFHHKLMINPERLSIRIKSEEPSFLTKMNEVDQSNSIYTNDMVNPFGIVKKDITNLEKDILPNVGRTIREAHQLEINRETANFAVTENSIGDDGESIYLSLEDGSVKNFLNKRVSIELIDATGKTNNNEVEVFSIPFGVYTENFDWPFSVVLDKLVLNSYVRDIQLLEYNDDVLVNTESIYDDIYRDTYSDVGSVMKKNIDVNSFTGFKKIKVKVLFYKDFYKTIELDDPNMDFINLIDIVRRDSFNIFVKKRDEFSKQSKPVYCVGSLFPTDDTYYGLGPTSGGDKFPESMVIDFSSTQTFTEKVDIESLSNDRIPEGLRRTSRPSCASGWTQTGPQFIGTHTNNPVGSYYIDQDGLFENILNTDIINREIGVFCKLNDNDLQSYVCMTFDYDHRSDIFIRHSNFRLDGAATISKINNGIPTIVNLRGPSDPSCDRKLRYRGSPRYSYGGFFPIGDHGGPNYGSMDIKGMLINCGFSAIIPSKVSRFLFIRSMIQEYYQFEDNIERIKHDITLYEREGNEVNERNLNYINRVLRMKPSFMLNADINIREMFNFSNMKRFNTDRDGYKNVLFMDHLMNYTMGDENLVGTTMSSRYGFHTAFDLTDLLSGLSDENLTSILFAEEYY